jgi:hypothetical protein
LLRGGERETEAIEEPGLGRHLHESCGVEGKGVVREDKHGANGLKLCISADKAEKDRDNNGIGVEQLQISAIQTR